MAYASKQFNGASYGVRKEYVLVEQIEKDIANNRSKLGITFCVYGSSSDASLFLHYATDIDVAGQNVFDYPETQWYGSGSSSNPKRTFPACEGSVYKEIWVGHDTSGNCTINVYFSTGIFASNTKGNYGGSMTLENIPRTSNPSTSGDVTLRNGHTIYTNRASNTFTHYISAWVNGTKVGEWGSVGDSVYWEPSVDIAHYIPNSDHAWCTIYCDTYSGSTLIGSSSTGMNVWVPTDLVPGPAISIAEADATMLSKGWGVLVKDKSKLNVNVTGYSSYSSAINTYSSTVQGTNYSGASYTSNILTQVGSFNATASVKDNRGRTSGTASTPFTVIDYFKPKINNATITRCTIDGVENDEGEYLLFTFVGEIAPVSNKNSKTFRLGYREKGSNTGYTWLTVSTSYTSSAIAVIITENGSKKKFSTDDSYDIRFEAIDSFETVYILKEVGTGFDLINLNASGNSMAIGKISEAGPNERKLEIDLDTYYKGVSLSDMIGKKAIIRTPSPNGNLNFWVKLLDIDVPIQWSGQIVKLNVYLVGESIGYLTFVIKVRNNADPSIVCLDGSEYHENMKDWYIYYDTEKTHFELWRTNVHGGYNFCLAEAYYYTEADVVGGNNNQVTIYDRPDFGNPSLPNRKKMDLNYNGRKQNSFGMLVRWTNLTYEDGSNNWQFHPVGFETTYGWNGNNYLLNSGDGHTITIGEDVELVEVSGWVTVLQANVGGALEIGVTVNGNMTGVIGFNSTQYLGNTTTYYVPPTPLEVHQGDKIGLNFCNSSGGTTILYADNGRPAIALKVKVIR